VALIEATEGLLKALQGEPVVPKIEVAKAEVAKALVDLREAVGEAQPEPDAFELGAALRDREKKIKEAKSKVRKGKGGDGAT